MSPSPSLTDDVIGSFLKCRYKAHLKLHRTAEEPSEYQQLQTRLAAEYHLAARREILRTRDPAAALISPASLAEALHRRPALIFDVVVDDAGRSCRLDALERAPGGAYAPVLFSRHQRITSADRVRFAFGASVLASIQGLEPQTGRIVHGPQFRSTRVSLPTLPRQSGTRSTRFGRSAKPPRPRRWC
jgi:hypothetical protein